MESLSAVRLRDQAAEQIRAAIVSGEFEAGEIYSATTIADRFGVSATPIREAMLDLANAGLVEAVRNRGFRVLSVGDKDLDEISELRLLMEPPMVRKVTDLATDEQILALEQHVAETEEAAKAKDVPEFVAADRRFHLALLSLAENVRLTNMVSQLRDQTRLVGLQRLAGSGDLDSSAAEHRAIYDAVKHRNGQEAFDLTYAHLEHTRGIWAGLPEGSE